jgi:hypothetical protein
MGLVTFSSHKACIEKIISTRVYPFNLDGQIEKKDFILHELVSFFMTSKAILIVFSAMVLSSLLTLGQVLVSSSFAQENMTGATNDTGATTGGNQTNQTGEGNQTQQGPLEQLGEALGGMFGGGGNQSQ